MNDGAKTPAPDSQVDTIVIPSSCCSMTTASAIDFAITEMAKENMQAAFEKWAERKGMNLKKTHDGQYVFQPAFYAWMGWRAGNEV